jgi:hypothetical protein
VSKGIGFALASGLGGVKDEKKIAEWNPADGDARSKSWDSDYRKKNMYYVTHVGIRYAFQDYAPQSFAMLRKRYGISTKLFYQSVVTQGMTGGLQGAGKSGMLFYFTRDKRFILKTIKQSELKFFRYNTTALSPEHANSRVCSHRLICVCSLSCLCADCACCAVFVVPIST